MSTPDKTSETLNLAAAMNANPSTSGSNDDNVVSKAKSKDDDLNANLSEFTKRLNDIDLSFRQKVVSKESSSEFMKVQEEDKAASSSHPYQGKSGAAPVKKVKNAGLIDLTTADYDDEAQVMIKPDDEKDWKKSEPGNVYHKVQMMQKMDHKKYQPHEYFKKEERTVENIQVRPEVVNCPKCHRKVAAGAIHHHIKFCNPEPSQ